MPAQDVLVIGLGYVGLPAGHPGRAVRVPGHRPGHEREDRGRADGRAVARG